MNNKTEFLKQCFVLDTETTSDDYKTAEIIEIGWAEYSDYGWGFSQFLHKPSNPIPPIVQSICYITNEMVNDKSKFNHEDYSQVLLKNTDNRYYIAHNSFYDMRVLQNHNVDLEKFKWIDTLRLVKKLYNDDKDMINLKLPYLRFYFELDIPIELPCHRAGQDSLITGELLEYLVGVMEDRGIIDQSRPYGPQIYDWALEPIIYTKMPVGKHKNELLDNVPLNYINWALSNMDSLNEDADNYDPDFAQSIVLSLERRGVI